MTTYTAIALFLLAPAIGFAQTPAPAIATLTVKGYTGQATVIQVNGKSYVDIESLARLTGGTLSFRTNQVTLTLPAGGAAPVSTPADRLSKDVVRATIEEMSAIGEWRTALVQAIQSGNPLTQDWSIPFRRNAESKLSLAATTVTTDPDRSLLLLLRGEFDNMQALSDRYVALRKGLTFVSTDALDDDPLNRQIQNCAQGLASLSAGAPFTDVAACH